MRRIGILLLLLGLLSSAYTRPTGARPASVTSRPTEISTSALPSAASLPGPGSTHIPPVPTTTITRADLGQTLRLAVGETFALRLGGDTAWDVQVTDPRVIAPDQARISGPGQQGIYRARAAGVTELVAVSLPPCAKDQPSCKVMAPAFRLLIVVH